ncbi:MAG: short-chain dehydrogenase [Bacteroidetes bacterium]|nr:MAG: short-chain dehydrogenase [Bacteroidota bacterium]
MTSEQISNFLEPNHLAKDTVKISFKTRNMLLGMFIDSPEYRDLKAKNYWRIVPVTNIERWKKTKDMSLVKIYNGVEFTKLAAA